MHGNGISRRVGIAAISVALAQAFFGLLVAVVWALVLGADVAHSADKTLPPPDSTGRFPPPSAASKPPLSNFPCTLGAMAGGELSANNGVNSTSGFYQGGFVGSGGGYVGASASCQIGTSGPVTWSVVPTLDTQFNQLSFNGLGGGFPVSGSGSLWQTDYFALLKLTFPLTPEYNLSLFGGPGASTLKPSGQPTGFGGPHITGSDTVFAYRLGVELSKTLAAGWLVGLQLAYQHTNESKFPTTLPDEDFRFRTGDRVMLGLNVQCCDYRPPPPPGISTVERLTPPPTTTDHNPPPKTPPKTTGGAVTTTPKKPTSVCGPDITDAVLDVLKDMKKDYDGLKAKNPDVAAKACSNLTSPSTGAGAWDIHGLDPHSSAVEGESDFLKPDGLTYTDKGGTVRLDHWFTGVTNACAIPRPQCAATAVFMGRCVQPQVLNYIQWGAMKKLCNGGTGFSIAKQGYNMLKLKSQTIINEEGATADVGEAYIDALGKNADPDLSKIKENWQNDYDGVSINYKGKRIPHGLVKFENERKCELACPPLTAEMKKAIKDRLNGYDWTGMPGH
jgi:hypothetical protein